MAHASSPAPDLWNSCGLARLASARGLTIPISHQCVFMVQLYTQRFLFHGRRESSPHHFKQVRVHCISFFLLSVNVHVRAHSDCFNRDANSGQLPTI
jgi:hypothetical protein